MNFKMSYTTDNHVVMASMFNTHVLRGRDKMVALFKTISKFLKLIFLYGIVLLFFFFSNLPLMCFKISKYKFIVLFYHPALRLIVGVQTPCTACRHYMETISLILLRCEGKSTGHRWIPRTKGK